MTTEPDRSDREARNTDRLFKVAIALKGIDGALQLVGALLVIIVPPTLIIGLANTVVTRDLVGDPNGKLASRFETAANHFTNGDTRTFAIIYLLAHAVVKLGLVWALLKQWRAAFPVAVVVLAAFVVYEVWRAVHTHSILLPIFAALDVVIIVLIIREYRQLRAEDRH